jgi:rubrerythrin
MTVEEYKRIIAEAIGAEIEAYEFYAGVAEKTQDSNVKSIFEELANEEKSHRDFLEGVLSDRKPMSIDETKDYKISAMVDKPKLSVTMKPVDAIALAMKNEEEAMIMYTALADVSNGKEQKELFESLARMERGHKFRLEEMYTNMSFPDVW